MSEAVELESGDTFNGDNAALVRSIAALIALNKRAAFPNPVPGLAVQLLTAAAHRLASLTGEGEPVGRVDRPALDIPALQREVAEIIVHDVLQEEYDDLVEGYLDEIMRASLRIIRLPGYSVVARAFETNLADALISASGGGE